MILMTMVELQMQNTWDYDCGGTVSKKRSTMTVDSRCRTNEHDAQYTHDAMTDVAPCPRNYQRWLVIVRVEQMSMMPGIRYESDEHN